MAARRGRRIVRTQSLLPLRKGRTLTHTVSCWYCDFKISAFNELLYSIGRKHTRFLKVWFTVGVGVSFMVFIGIIMVLFWELTQALHLFNGNAVALWNLPYDQFFGLSSLAHRLSISFMDAGNIILSTLMSVAAHEFGHALAAARSNASLGIVSNRLCWKAISKSSPRKALFQRIEFRFCAVCGLTLFFLPLLLCPFYIHGKGPMVLSVTPSSPLSGYLSHGDVVVSLDGLRINDPQEWMDRLALLDSQMLQKSNSSEGSRSSWATVSGKGYCVPNSWLEESKKLRPVYDRFSCPDELTPFLSLRCLNLSQLADKISEGSNENITEIGYCLIPNDVVKLKKCGHGWPTLRISSGSCSCLQDETCIGPVQMPGLAWVEIGVSRPYSAGCLVGGNLLSGFGNPNSGSANCGGDFIFVGDMLSVAKSVQLTSYQPRWAFSLGPYLPNALEKLLASIFQVSMALAFLNGMPVFLLDGESILEVSLCYISWLSPRKRELALKFCLLGGSLLSILTLSRIFRSLLFVNNV